MRIIGFIWIDQFVDKLEFKHNVYCDEVEQLFANHPQIRRLQRGHLLGEDVYRALGRTHDGRYLVVFFVYKLSSEALVLSARDMDEKERRSYAKK